MTNRILAMVKPLALGIFAVAILALAQGVARADEVTIAGSTSGAFGGTTTGLSYTSSTFNVTTAGGFAGLGAPAASPNFNNLGSFSLEPNSGVLNGTFTLTVNFTAPAGIAGGGSTIYTATVTGTVGATDVGGAQISFDAATRSQVFTFNDGTTSGSFTLTLPDFVSVTSGRTIALSGTITGAQQQTTVPEPATMILLGTGLSGVAAFARRRRKTVK